MKADAEIYESLRLCNQEVESLSLQRDALHRALKTLADAIAPAMLEDYGTPNFRRAVSDANLVLVTIPNLRRK